MKKLSLDQMAVVKGGGIGANCMGWGALATFGFLTSFTGGGIIIGIGAVGMAKIEGCFD